MRDQKNMPLNHNAIRRHLLVTASAIALTAWSVQNAYAEDTDHPIIWIEFGGQAEALSGQGQPFSAPYMSTYATSPVLSHVTPLDVQKPPRYSIGGEAAITFQPKDSDWKLSAKIRYGRSNSNRVVHQQTPGVPVPTTSVFYQFFEYYYPGFGPKTVTAANAYAEDKVRHKEKHDIVDFEVGKDVGLGLFGHSSMSTINAGVRIAQFSSSSHVDLKNRPDNRVEFPTYAPKYIQYEHNFSLTGSSDRSFRGIGPSVSWNASMPIAGNANDGELDFDIGINAAVLFGKQKAKVQHQTSGHYKNGKYGYHLLYQTSNNSSRSRSVTVPNVGGFAGLSYRFVDAKLSLGYRADYFLGAMDGGIDATKKTTLSFNGPFASISIGLGD